MPDRNRLTWRKSSYSGVQTNCVEIAIDSQQITVRDSKNTTGPTLAFAASTWRAFLSITR